MSKQRIYAADTIEYAQWSLNKLASEGWGIESVRLDVEYHKKAAGLPIGAELRVKLIPRNAR